MTQKPTHRKLVSVVYGQAPNGQHYIGTFWNDGYSARLAASIQDIAEMCAWLLRQKAVFRGVNTFPDGTKAEWVTL